MLDIHFKDWGKNRPQKHYNRLHELRIFELIFSTEITKLGIHLNNFNRINVYCLANPNKKVSIDEERAIGEIRILIPYDFMEVIELESFQAKFQTFCELVRMYIVPILEQYSNIPASKVKSYVEETKLYTQDSWELSNGKMKI